MASTPSATPNTDEVAKLWEQGSTAWVEGCLHGGLTPAQLERRLAPLATAIRSQHAPHVLAEAISVGLLVPDGKRGWKEYLAMADAMKKEGFREEVLKRYRHEVNKRKAPAGHTPQTVVYVQMFKEARAELAREVKGIRGECEPYIKKHEKFATTVHTVGEQERAVKKFEDEFLAEHIAKYCAQGSVQHQLDNFFQVQVLRFQQTGHARKAKRFRDLLDLKSRPYA